VRGGDEGGCVAFTVEAEGGLGDIVGDDGIGAFAFQLLPSVANEVLRVDGVSAAKAMSNVPGLRWAATLCAMSSVGSSKSVSGPVRLSFCGRRRRDGSRRPQRP